MEDALGVTHGKKGELNGSRAVVRYADDFCVFCESQEDAEQAKMLLSTWLAERGLVLSDEKTHIVHISEGFNFLGFNIRHYQVSTTKTGWKLLIKPSKEAVQKHRDRMKAEWEMARGQSIERILWKLNPIIRGWANYHRRGTAKATFGMLDSWMFTKEVRYVKHTPPHKSTTWQQHTYWGQLNPARQDNWVFGDKHTRRCLLKYSWFPIERHLLVKGTASPDDPALKVYWQQRATAKARDLAPNRYKIAMKQQGLCPMCKNSLFKEEEVQVHHNVPKAQGGKDTYGNLVLVHLYCHQQHHASGRGEVGVLESGSE